MGPEPRRRGGQFDDHLAIACLAGMVLILDGADRVVSVVGGMPPWGSNRTYPIGLEPL